MRGLTLGLVAAALLGGGGALGYAVWRPDDGQAAFRVAKVERGDITAAVSASGTVMPVVTVQVGSQVSGQIRELLADFNTEVVKDQLIARIDSDTFETRVAQAEADLQVAKANQVLQEASLERLAAELETTRQTLASLRAQTRKAALAETDGEREFKRRAELLQTGAASRSDFDKSKTNYDSAVAQSRSAQAQEQGQVAAVRAVEAQIKMGQAQVLTARAQVAQREAALRQAQIDLDRTFIRSPVKGTVVLRNVDAGQTVAASLQAPILFQIAEDLTRMQIETAVDEADVGRVKVGQKATFTVDAFPTRTFDAEVLQIRKSPKVQSNVVTYTVVISADNSDQALLPGMTANARIVTDQRRGALKIPNAALRFRPPGAEAAPAAAQPASGAPSPAAQQAAAVRERLITALSLTPDQQEKLTQIFAQARSQLAGLQGASEAERKRRGDQVRAESRRQIAEMLTPEQKAKYDELVAEQAGRQATAGRVFVPDGSGQPKPVQVRLGVGDGSTTELLGTTLKEGDQILVGLAPKGTAASQPRAAGLR
ncbi:efflux RND transporter periplasmic adaptor subunit [Desertibaculum subflavum]|uniref:efflux RND transporter periplasmic adaptor subunit n=1 Tax=Desertibaculum subflavum TaxID=2268458 RepID=UPI000E667836